MKGEEKKDKNEVKRVEFYCHECQKFVMVIDKMGLSVDDVPEWRATKISKDHHLTIYTCSDCGSILGKTLIKKK